MSRIATYLKELGAIFRSTRDKREANYRCKTVLSDMSGDANLLTEVIAKHISTRGSLNVLHYPVVAMDVELNEDFGLVANCWIPLPNRDTNISSKSIHHHGNMLLSTVTAHGSGYEHWTFETPAVVDAAKDVFDLRLLEVAPHPVHHVAFVDAYIAHLPMYPPDCTVTYALWSNQFPTTWRNRLKRIPVFQNNSERLRRIAAKIGMREMLQLNVIEYFDFYPCADGFRGMKERKEFERSNNEDYLYSLFFVLQQTGNDNLGPLIAEKLDSNEQVSNRELVSSLLADLSAGVPIEGRISDNHFGFHYANFTREEILSALKVDSRGKTRGVSDLGS